MGACLKKSERPRFSFETRREVRTSVVAGASAESSHRAAFTLTNAQRAIISRTWPTIVMDMANNGVSVMLKLLDSRPDAKVLFDFRNKTGSDMIMDRAFRSHSYRFLQAVNAVIENLDNLEETAGILFFRLGKKHLDFPDFEPSYLTMLPETYCFVWESQLTERFNDPTERVWREVFGYIVSKMKEGYEAEIALRERAKRRLACLDRAPDASIPSWDMMIQRTPTESEAEIASRNDPFLEKFISRKRGDSLMSNLSSAID